MSLTLLVVGIAGQMFLAGLLFMIAAFAGGAAGSDGLPAAWQMTVLNAALWVLPGLSLVSAIIMIWAYVHDAGTSTCWWHLLPVAGAVAYFVFLATMRSS